MNGMNSGKPYQDTDGNPEPSRGYTFGRCRDYLGTGRKAEVSLITGKSVPRPNNAVVGDEIVHA